MKKCLFFVAALLVMVFCVSSCGNYDLFDTNYKFHTAICHFPDGTTKTYQIASWSDYEGEQLQITEPDGTVHLLSANYTELIGTKGFLPN